MPQTWYDNTGLYQKYGVDQTTVQAGGEYKTFGEHRELEIKLDLTKLTNSSSVVIGADNIFIPAGMQIESVTVSVVNAGATGAAINVGMIRTDRTTVVDATGILAAFPVASMTAGTVTSLTKGSTYAGTQVGNTTANVTHFTAATTTGTAFTAGLLYIRVRYIRA